MTFRPLVFVIFAIAVWPAAADILFFDLNDNQMERKAAERAAAKRGERLIDVSLVDEPTRQRVRELQIDLETVETEKRKRCWGKGKESDACGSAKRDFEIAQNSYNNFTTKIRRFGAGDLDSILADAKKRSADITSIVISGHNGDRQYWGTLGWFEDDDLMNALEANQPVGQNLRSLYLWGCYTGITDDYKRQWKRGIPNSTMIAGYDGQSPLGSQRSAKSELGPSADLLEDLLVKEASLNEARDRRELTDIFKSLPNINNANMHASICLNNRETIVSRKGVRNPEEDDKYCDPSDGLEARWEERFECYRRALPESGCEEIPDWTDDRNELRKMYSYSQTTKHCYFVDELRGIKRQLIPVQVRRLLFDNLIRRNFERLHKKDLEALNRLLSHLDFPPHLRLGGIGAMSRGQYLARKRAIKDYWNLQARARTDSQGRLRDTHLLAVENYLSAIDRIEDGMCVPGSWLEPRGPLDDSQCGPKEGMPTIGDQMKNALKDAQQTVSSYGGQ